MKNFILKSALFALLIFATLNCRGGIPDEQSETDKETLIILGFPANADGTPSVLMKYRLDKALKIYNPEKTVAIITTGGAVQNKFEEAVVMKNYLVQKGIPAEKIFAETSAKSTFGNAHYSSKIIKKKNLPNPVIVTSEEHRERAAWTFSLFLKNFRVAN